MKSQLPSNIAIILVLILTLAFQLNSLIICGPNCAICLSANSCESCNVGYGVTISRRCIASTIQNCRVYANNGSCLICEPTFLPSNNGTICVKQYSGCVMRNSIGNCLYCLYGMKLTLNQCSGVLNCESNSQNCQSCTSGYQLIANKCFDLRPYCRSRDINGACASCADPYILNGYNCVLRNLIPNECTLYDGLKGTCIICKIGYEKTNGACMAINSISNVFSSNALSSSSVSISTTVSSLRMPSDYLAFSISNNNDVLDGLSAATSTLYITKSSYTGQGTQYLDNCFIKDPQTNLCSTCVDGYILSASLANKCILKMLACVNLNLQTMTCLQCDVSLTLINGQCIDINCLVNGVSMCLTCINNYAPNQQGICLSLHCLGVMNGRCSICANGYTLNTVTNSCQEQGTPTAIIETNSIKGCELVVNNKCGRCTYPYLLNNVGGCDRTVIGCLQMDSSKQNCMQCMNQYTLNTSNGGCDLNGIPTTNTTSSVTNRTDPNCLVVNGKICAVCKNRYYLNPYNFTCMFVAPECLTYSSKGDCLSCVPTYILFKMYCLKPLSKTDPSCLISDNNNFCKQCVNSYYQYRGICLQANTLCKTFQPDGGSCLTCYDGYSVYQGQCYLLSNQPNCLQYDTRSICISCSQRYYILNTICTSVSVLCGDYNLNDGSCINCISGYGLNAFKDCQKIKDKPLNCDSADILGNCLRCSNRYYLSSINNSCLVVNTLCNGYIMASGVCSSCISGYSVFNSNSNTNGSINCLRNDLISSCSMSTSNGLCSRCKTGFILTVDRSCILNSPYCANYSLTGICQKCIPLYYLKNNSCVKELLGKLKDKNCLVSDLYNYCLKCVDGFYISEGNCFLADQNCKTFDQNGGDCLSCYDGYRLVSNKCFLGVPILNCKVFSGSICQECADRYYLNPDASCAQASNLCNTYDSNNGFCLSCYDGYALFNGTCVSTSSGNTNDPFCQNSASNGCLNCILGYYIDSATGKCLPVSLLCTKNYSMTSGNCLSCDSQTDVLQNGVCFSPIFGKDINCILYANSYCITCQSGFALTNFICTAI